MAALFGGLAAASIFGAVGNTISASLTAHSNEKIEGLRSESNLDIARLQSESDESKARLQNQLLSRESVLKDNRFRTEYREAKLLNDKKLNLQQTQTASQVLYNAEKQKIDKMKFKMTGRLLEDISMDKPFKFDDNEINRMLRTSTGIEDQASSALIRGSQDAFKNGLFVNTSDRI